MEAKSVLITGFRTETELTRFTEWMNGEGDQDFLDSITQEEAEEGQPCLVREVRDAKDGNKIIVMGHW